MEHQKTIAELLAAIGSLKARVSEAVEADEWIRRAIAERDACQRRLTQKITQAEKVKTEKRVKDLTHDIEKACAAGGRDKVKTAVHNLAARVDGFLDTVSLSYRRSQQIRSDIETRSLFSPSLSHQRLVSPRKMAGALHELAYLDSIRRVRKTKCLGKVSEITSREAQKEAQRFLQPINDVVEGIEHTEKTVSQLTAQWQAAVKPNLKPSTQASYEWGFKRINQVFGRFAVADIERADVQAFLTEARKQLAPESIHDLHARLSGLFSTAEHWGWIPRGTNPAKGKLYLPERIPPRRKRILTPEQFQNS